MPVNKENKTSKPSSSKDIQFNQRIAGKSDFKSSQETLFQTLMNDPVKKAFLLNLLTNEKENIKKYKQQQEEKGNRTPTNKHKRLYCESPTALLRRKALEKNGQAQSSPTEYRTPTSSPVPFERLLEGVVGYVEIRSNGVDRSAGAKTLMKSMGAKISERLKSGVTHVIFKDSSFTTYQKAKLLKAHLVSVLWLEAVRKSNWRVPEKNYPALGIEAYDADVSDIFQEYESVVNEEYRRSLAVGSQHSSSSQRKGRLTALPSELLHKRRTSIRRMSNIVPSSQDYELESIISSRSIQSSKTHSKENSVLVDTSDDDSECGVINGRSFTQLKESLLSNLESQINQFQERLIEPGQDNEDPQHEKLDNNDHSRTVPVQNDILINNQSVSTSSSRSVSLLSRKSVVNDKTINITSDMELTNNISADRSVKRKSLHFGDESELQQKRNRQSLPATNYNIGELSSHMVLSDSLPCSSQLHKTVKNRHSVRLLRDTSVNCEANNITEQIASVEQQQPSSEQSENSDTMPILRLSTESERLNGIRKSSKDRSSKSPNKTTEEQRNNQNLDSLSQNLNSQKSLIVVLERSETQNSSVDQPNSQKSTNGIETRKSTRLSKIHLEAQSNKVVANRSSSGSKPADSTKTVEELKSTRKSTRLSKARVDESFEKRCTVQMEINSNLQQECTHLPIDSSTINLEQSLKNNNQSAARTSNSENMTSLRISTDSGDKGGNRESSSSDLRRSNEPENLRRSLRRSTLSKNSETMSSLRISSETGLSKDSKLGNINQSSVNNTNEISDKLKTGSNLPINKSKNVRKLYNLNQSPSKIQELAMSNCENNEATALPIPDMSPSAKLLIVPLTRLIFRGKMKKTLKINRNHKKKIPKKTAIVKPPPILHPADDSERNDNNGLTVSNLALLQTQFTPQGSRRSTFEFVVDPVPKKKNHCVKKAKTSIVCTRMHKSEVKVFTEAVQKLGNFYVEDEVGETTTHLVVGEAKRTINLLKAIIRGCWIVTKDWLLKSIDAGQWLKEEDYELTDFSPAIKQCRTERQAFGELYSMDIFNDCEPIYISETSNPKRSELTELIELCKGTIAREKNDAKIVIADQIEQDGVNCVTEKWILDSITYNKKKSFKKYLIRNTS